MGTKETNWQATAPARFFELRVMTREEYVQCCKESAVALLRDGRLREAVASMMSDMRKRADCRAPHVINSIRVIAVSAGDASLALAYIDWFT